MVAFLLLLIAPLSPIGGEGLSFHSVTHLLKTQSACSATAPRTGYCFYFRIQSYSSVRGAWSLKRSSL
ncbi:MAG: hypothetical protein V7606_3850 [Burkholderiales bacterium]